MAIFPLKLTRCERDTADFNPQSNHNTMTHEIEELPNPAALSSMRGWFTGVPR
jgi:hypothetical protein